MERLANSARQRLSVQPGDYAIWRSRSGCEIWFHVVGDRRDDGVLHAHGIEGLTPFYEGSSAVMVRLERQVRRADDNDFEGAFVAWVDPDRDGNQPAYPIVFDAIDFAARRDRKLPSSCAVRLVGFVRTMLVFADEAAFRRGGSETAGLEPHSFVAIGIAAVAALPKPGNGAAPSSHALVNGMVIEHALVRNEETGTEFHRMLVASDSAVYDMVAGLHVVPPSIGPGVFVSAMCWMVGRILDDH